MFIVVLAADVQAYVAFPVVCADCPAAVGDPEEEGRRREGAGRGGGAGR